MQISLVKTGRHTGIEGSSTDFEGDRLLTSFPGGYGISSWPGVGLISEHICIYAVREFR